MPYIWHEPSQAHNDGNNNKNNNDAQTPAINMAGSQTGLMNDKNDI